MCQVEREAWSRSPICMHERVVLRCPASINRTSIIAVLKKAEHVRQSVTVSERTRLVLGWSGSVGPDDGHAMSDAGERITDT